MNYVETAHQGTLFFAKEIPGEEYSEWLKKSIRIYTARTESVCFRDYPRWRVTEGEPLNSNFFFFCNGSECGVCQTPGWVVSMEGYHRCVGNKPCELEVAIDIATNGRGPLNTPEAIVVCEGGNHIAAYDCGYFPPSRRLIGGPYDANEAAYLAAKRGDPAGDEYSAAQAAEDEAYKASFVPKPCPVCGRVIHPDI